VPDTPGPRALKAPGNQGGVEDGVEDGVEAVRAHGMSGDDENRWRKRLAARVCDADLSREQSVEVFRMLSGAGLEHSKNDNGVFFDVTSCDKGVLLRLESFLEYCDNCASMLRDSHNLRSRIASQDAASGSRQEAAPRPPPMPGPRAGPRAGTETDNADIAESGEPDSADADSDLMYAAAEEEHATRGKRRGATQKPYNVRADVVLQRRKQNIAASFSRRFKKPWPHRPLGGAALQPETPGTA